MKFIIHTSPKRIDFVRKYMVPTFMRYGINDIMIYNDDVMVGQINAWVDCARYIVKTQGSAGGIWHLEDDVIPCKNFKKETEVAEKEDIIIQGFYTKHPDFGFKGKTGILPVQELTDGTQCIYIPNRYLPEFIDFFDNVVKNGGYRKKQFISGTLYADAAFKGFLRRKHKNDKVDIWRKCLVDHIDYLIGGSSVGVKRTSKICNAYNFDNSDEIEILKMYLEAQNGETKDRY